MYAVKIERQIKSSYGRVAQSIYSEKLGALAEGQNWTAKVADINNDRFQVCIGTGSGFKS